jgi:hypothetical protein
MKHLICITYKFDSTNLLKCQPILHIKPIF